MFLFLNFLTLKRFSANLSYTHYCKVNITANPFCDSILLFLIVGQVMLNGEKVKVVVFILLSLNK